MRINKPDTGAWKITTPIQIVLIVLKLCHFKSWPWVWVMLPTIIPVSLVGGMFIIGVLLLLVGKIMGMFSK